MVTGYNIREGSTILAMRRAKQEADELQRQARIRADIVRRGFDPMGVVSKQRRTRLRGCA